MSIFDNKRLDNSIFKLDIERMRQAWYTDKYFSNITMMLEKLKFRKISFFRRHFQIAGINEK